MKLNLPNLLTLLRIVLIPLVVVAFFLPFPWGRPVSAWLFVIAAVTDYFDGYLARRLNQTSSFGAFLDPVADKLIVSTALVLLVQAEPTFTLSIVAAIIIGREITVSALREWMAELGERAHVAVSMFGKIKTTMQMVGISLMLYRLDVFGLPIYELGALCLLIAAALTIWSMVGYLRAAWPVLRSRT